MKKSTYTLLTLISLFFCTTIFGQVSGIYIKVAGITGEATAAGYENTIAATAYAQSIKGCPVVFGGGGAEACKNSIGAFGFEMALNNSVIGLKNHQLTGKVITAVDITFIKHDNDKGLIYYKVRMENVYVTEVSESNKDPYSSRPSFYVELDAQKIAWQYWKYGSTATPTKTQFGWDRAINAPWVFFSGK